MWFLVGLRDRLSQVDASGLPPLVFSAGLVFVTLGLVGAMIGTAVPASLLNSEEWSSRTSTPSASC